MASTVTIQSGFFDSTEDAPRSYTAEEFSSIFDGLISDGVYENYPGGTRTSGGKTTKIPPFEVTKVTGSGLAVNVGPGRGWFNHVWVLNSNTNLDIAAAHSTIDRRDTVSIRVRLGSRDASLMINQGATDGNVTPNVPSDTSDTFYYPIAYVKVPHGAASSSSLVIEPAIGVDNRSKTKFIKAIVEPSISLHEYIQSYIDQVNEWKDDMVELCTDTPLQYAAAVTDVAERVSRLENGTGSEGLGGEISSLRSEYTNYKTKTIAPALDTLSQIVKYFSTSFQYYNSSDYSINYPRCTICRMTSKVKGTKPVGMGNQWVVVTMTLDSTSKYNAQLAFGFGYRIAIRYKNNSTSWNKPWRYVNLTLTK